jgi:quercetin 2,3-dioxygenase
MEGFQLWANLPAADKMMAPRYREVKRDQIPEISLADGVTIRIICGAVGGVRGPVRDIVTDPEYLDLTVPPKTEFIFPTRTGYTVFAYIIGGKARFSRGSAPVSNENLVLFGDGEQIVASTEDEAVRFLLISGKPVGEPVAWYGPVVMNTQKELDAAFEELRKGTFIKHGKE